MFVSSDFLELLQRDEERERGSVADDERWDIIDFVLLYFSCQFLNEKHYSMLFFDSANKKNVAMQRTKAKLQVWSPLFSSVQSLSHVRLFATP